MKEHLQVKTFDNPTGNTEKECNEFLKQMGNSVADVTPLYNSTLGGVIYTVTYWG